jgi:phosphotransacetylase
MIDKKTNEMGLCEDEMTIIKAMHNATNKTYAECFIELVKVDWNLYEAVRNVWDAKKAA